MSNVLTKMGVACSTSLVVAETISLEPLYSALITLAVSVLSCLAVEGVNWLKAYFKKKKEKIEDEGK